MLAKEKGPTQQVNVCPSSTTSNVTVGVRDNVPKLVINEVTDKLEFFLIKMLLSRVINNCYKNNHEIKLLSEKVSKNKSYIKK